MVPLLYSYSPHSRDILETDVGKRGWEICRSRNPIVPCHLDPFQQSGSFQRCRETYMYFHVVQRRIPVSGDVLQKQEIEKRWGVHVMAKAVGEFRAAWARRLPQLPCPVKFGQDRVWCRSAESKPGKELWEQDEFPQTTPEIWPLIEAEALGKDSSPKESRTTLRAVVLREDEDANFYTEPFKVSQ